MENLGPIDFGRFCIDRLRRRLLLDGRPVALNGKAFDLLLIFATSDGAALARESLYTLLWPNRVVEDANLSQTIYLLRRALDQGSDGREYIETVPRYGYRFTAPISENKAIARPVRRSAVWALAAIATAATLLLCLWSLRATTAPLSAAAREEYALGEYHLSLRTPTDLPYARDYFEQVERDAPRSALGYAGAASATALLAEFRVNGSLAQRQLVASAKRDISATLARDPRNSDAQAVAGFIAYRFQNDRGTAERDLEQSVVRDPTNAAAHHWHGVVLLVAGRNAKAIEELEAAHRLQPTSEVYSRWLARAYLYARRPGDAIALATQTVRIEHDDAPAWLTIATAQEQRGNLRAALQTLRTLANVDPYEAPYVIPDEARLEVRLGRHQVSLLSKIDRLAATTHLDPFETALFYLTVGKRTIALHLLHDATRPPFLTALEGQDPRLRSLVHDPPTPTLFPARSSLVQ